MTKTLSSFIEILSAVVIAIALIRFVVLYSKNMLQPMAERNNQQIRIQFGSSLTIALELLLAADILATAIAPTWDDIGKLAAIAVLRTSLNYFLERELKASGLTKNLPARKCCRLYKRRGPCGLIFSIIYVNGSGRKIPAVHPDNSNLQTGALPVFLCLESWLGMVFW